MEVNEREEAERIKLTIQSYVEGVAEFNFEKAENSWHTRGVKIYYDSDSDSLKTITMLQSRPSSKPSIAIKQTAEIESLDIFGQAACVKLKWSVEREEKKRICVDYVSLIKIKKDWKIVSKISDVKSA
ncbi:MAG: nuclear transport factor 2 family protein [Candidatus Heimdallarchaeota archaeon]|nr:nuclear transport factor 2 family protein [Candidatus Heimdallarchaeota archaeon]MCG3256107.1 nuclear transport factor 2 family protein [Candidatus Heimdallarchaeota archaeon]MCK4611177.1 nuclear transport factor 2 family protein [Candidatus Heimdallarchaeota archaeon]